MSETSCPNLNHSHQHATVRHCPICGDVVNARVPLKRDCREQHARRRREQRAYCTDCGEQLMR